MSNERFDRLMKKNLESVRPGYQPSAWNRFQKRLPLGFWARLLPYGGWMLSALTLTGWLTTLYTLHINQQVIRQLTKTVAQQTNPVKPEPTSITSSVSAHRVDTVYVIHRTVVEHQMATQRIKTLSYPSGLVGISDQIVRSHVGRNKAQLALAEQGKPATARAVRYNQNTGISEAETQLATSAKRSVADSANLINSPGPTDELIPTDVNQSQLTKVPLVNTDSVNRPPVSSPVTAQAAQPAKKSRPLFRLSSLLPRLGVETEATLNGVGVGPSIEFFPTENFGVSLGIQAAQLGLEEQRELRDFNAATGIEFIQQYRFFLPAQYDQIKDITVRTSLVSLPVFLKYYVPMRRNWSLQFQTGSSFDIAAYQQVHYESFYRGDEVFHSFEVDTKPCFFHNFMFGAGVQYRQGRISAQVSPYYLYDFRSIANTPVGSNVGIKASVWLDVFK